MLFLSIYRPPKQKNLSGTNYQRKLEEEINDICHWACFQKQWVVIIGDLNMDRMRPNNGEGKILKTERSNGKTVKDQTKVAEMLDNYFSTAAASIGGNHVSNLTEGDFNDHKSVKSIRKNFNGTCFTFKKFSMEEVPYAIENINPRKSCGWDRSLGCWRNSAIPDYYVQ